MKITKVNGSFNEYKLELSWGELEAVYDSMAKHHSGPIADEVFSGLQWYMDNRLPLPGEDADAKKKEGDDIDAQADAHLPDPDEFAQLDRPAPESPARLAQVEPSTGSEVDGELDQDDEADSRLPNPPAD